MDSEEKRQSQAASACRPPLPSGPQRRRKRVAIAVSLALPCVVFAADFLLFGPRNRYGRTAGNFDHAMQAVVVWCVVGIPLIWILWRLVEYVVQKPVARGSPSR